MAAIVINTPETPSWATDGTKIVDPPSGTKLTGFVPGDEAFAQHANWILNLLGAGGTGTGPGWQSFLYTSVYARLQWAGQFSVSPGGSSTVFSVNVGPIDLVVLSGGSLQQVPAATLGLSVVEGSPMSLSGNTWYYVYVGISGGAVVYRISTTAPVGAGAEAGTPTWEGGFRGTWRYLGCFVTDGSSNPIPVTAARGRYVYRRSAEGAGGASTTSTTFASLSLSAVPPHAAQVSVEMVISNTTSGAANATVGTNTSDSNGAGIVYHPGVASGTGHASRWADVVVDVANTPQAIAGKVSAAGVTLTVNVNGFAE